MKKILMTIAAAFVAVSMSAQYYVGGTVNFNNSTNKTNPLSEVTRTNFRIAPEIGMALDDNLGVGIAISYASNKTKVENTTAGASNETTISTVALRPYLRYQLLKFGKANVFVDGGVNFAMESKKDYKAGMDLGLYATPGIAFNVSKEWSIVAKLDNVFALGYSKDPIADVPGAPDAPSSFNFNASTGGFNVGALSFGVYYNF